MQFRSRYTNNPQHSRHILTAVLSVVIVMVELKLIEYTLALMQNNSLD